MTEPGSMTRASDLDEVQLETDVLVVGLGAGGSMVFHELARAGVDVLACELGGEYEPEAMTCREDEMLPRLFMEGGARATRDFSVRILQGKGVGGSTIHNTNLCKRLPDEILRQWRDEHGLDGLTPEALEEDFAYVEQLMGVKRIPDERVNAQNAVLERGLDALNYAGGRMSHNRSHTDCKESGFCELGCPNNGKQNAAKVLVPAGLEAGGRVITGAQVTQLKERNSEVVGAHVAAVDPVDGRVQGHIGIRCERVVLAASATGSPSLYKASSLPDPNRLVGTNLHMHPAAVVMGAFDRDDDAPINGWLGNPQSVECTEVLEYEHDSDKRAWIVTGFAHPAGASTFVPGFGAEHTALMKKYGRLASLIVMLHDHSAGRVSPADGQAVNIDYKLSGEDYRALEVGIKAAGRLMLAAGAREVIAPLVQPVRATNEAQLDAAFTADNLGPLDPPLAAVHPMSTMWMGTTPENSVVDADGRHHLVRNLWVADGSLFPTSIGGPPQIPIYTFGRRVARAMLATM
ncbi:MAG: GMC family oxidoreductase N-terminal domain-containing protein [Myxococcota bacterium]